MSHFSRAVGWGPTTVSHCLCPLPFSFMSVPLSQCLACVLYATCQLIFALKMTKSAVLGQHNTRDFLLLSSFLLPAPCPKGNVRISPDGHCEGHCSANISVISGLSDSTFGIPKPNSPPHLSVLRADRKERAWVKEPTDHPNPMLVIS